MTARIEIELDFTDPYKQTRVFVKDSRVFFGLWKPVDVVLDGDEAQVEVVDGMEGQLDLYAHRYYGDRRLWRVIAQANKIDFPMEEVTQGKILIIPKKKNVEAALLSAAARTTENSEVSSES